MSSTEPIVYSGVQTLSFSQLDSLNGFGKGTSFRLFKAGRHALVEGSDYFHLPYSTHSQLIESLKARGQIYSSTVNLVLLSRAGYARLRQVQQDRDQDTDRLRC